MRIKTRVIVKVKWRAPDSAIHNDLKGQDVFCVTLLINKAVRLMPYKSGIHGRTSTIQYMVNSPPPLNASNTPSKTMFGLIN